MNILRIVMTTALLALTACSGSSVGSILGGLGGLVTCNPGTQVQLARPSQGQTGAGALTSIEIVANGNSSTLGTNYQSWQLQVQANFGNTITGSALALVPDPSGPQPYASDFYYSSSFPALQTGQSYTVYLTQNGLCQPLNVGSFSN